MDRNSVNKVILIGRLGGDPETREVGGNTVASFTLATNDAWTDKSGQRQERTQWHRISVWGKLAEMCTRYLSKGRKVYVEGRLSYRDVESKDGEATRTIRYTDITAQNVQFLDSRGTGGSVDYEQNDGNEYAPTPSSGNQGKPRSQGRNQPNNPSHVPPMPPPPDDEDIPF